MKVIGHRGAMGLAPENTLLSFRKALELGVDGVEFDVQNIDGNLLVFHDDTLERTTNGSGLLLDHSIDYLRSLDAGQGEKIPFLHDVIELIDIDTFINIELKGLRTASLVMELVKLLDKDRYKKENFIISSYLYSELFLVRQLDPDIQIGVIADELPDVALSFARDVNAYSFHPSLSLVSKELVEQVHEEGMLLYVHTVNDPDNIAKVKAMGVDGIFTDYPDRVRQG
ncbi:glycerophosphodiester phosphodiesterase [Kangiella koreensis]|uniref:Glycerophosphodiester phosphodiesterase n=1 Tax=Kangiella koreensis (strain DSM 16069 / JCM 12317 / KCTC 12182 / SW-125) TaxID=523791 RepID=C7RD12_KANKD|nr:glycerophosphodiester phosphodiesterase family protein [Kangiella koreensis]ACV27154.1 Glycerophosphodiester phosphodiesterase [Kangiella koreensis DSM 16069]